MRMTKCSILLRRRTCLEAAKRSIEKLHPLAKSARAGDSFWKRDACRFLRQHCRRLFEHFRIGYLKPKEEVEGKKKRSPFTRGRSTRQGAPVRSRAGASASGRTATSTRTLAHRSARTRRRWWRGSQDDTATDKQAQHAQWTRKEREGSERHVGVSRGVSRTFARAGIVALPAEKSQSKATDHVFRDARSQVAHVVRQLLCAVVPPHELQADEMV